MNTRNTVYSIWVAGMVMVVGCAHSTNGKKLDSRLEQAPTLSGTSELRSQADRTIQSADGLSDEQRQRLLALRRVTSARMQEITEESLKLRSLLIQDVIASDFNSRQVSRLKDRIRENERERLSVMFDAVDRASAILGRQSKVRPDVMRGFFDLRGDQLD